MEFEKYQKVAIVTGANGGVGYGICQHLLETEGESLTLVMACRNPSRAANAKERLLLEFPFANIDIELVDVGSVQSVMSFSGSITNKYEIIIIFECKLILFYSGTLTLIICFVTLVF